MNTNTRKLIQSVSIKGRFVVQIKNPDNLKLSNMVTIHNEDITECSNLKTFAVAVSNT